MDFSAIRATIPCIRPRVSSRDSIEKGVMKKLTKMHFCHEIIKTGGARGGKMALDIKRVA